MGEVTAEERLSGFGFVRPVEAVTDETATVQGGEGEA